VPRGSTRRFAGLETAVTGDCDVTGTGGTALFAIPLGSTNRLPPMTLFTWALEYAIGLAPDIAVAP